MRPLSGDPLRLGSRLGLRASWHCRWISLQRWCSISQSTKISCSPLDHVATVSASNSSFRLRVVPIADLWEPLVLGAETGRVEFDAKIARDLFARPAFAAADDVSRAYLSGV